MSTFSSLSVVMTTVSQTNAVAVPAVLAVHKEVVKEMEEFAKAGQK